jgi:hypothetical protein
MIRKTIASLKDGGIPEAQKERKLDALFGLKELRRNVLQVQ